MNSVQNLLGTLALLASATPLLAQPEPHPISNRIASEGLAAVEADLATLSQPTDTERFALGAVRFLMAVETAQQTRWRHGITAEHSALPVLRLQMSANPAAEPFTPDMISGIFARVVEDMKGVEAALAPIPEGAEVDLPIALEDLWFDIDGDGVRSEVEEFAPLMGRAVTRAGETGPGPMVVAFDRSDVDWLRAYADLLSAAGEAVLAFDPTDAIARITDANAQLAALAPGTGGIFQTPLGIDRSLIDHVAIVLGALDQQPDAARLGRARDHLLAMVGHNRRFWEGVAAETDDRAEWIPSDSQTGALPLRYPEGLGEHWMAVLEDMEKVLRGELLIPHYLLQSPGLGIDLGAWVADPVPLNLPDWIHGVAAVPYLRQGKMISAGNLAAFNQMVGRNNGLLYGAILN